MYTLLYIYLTQRIHPAHTADRTQAHPSSGTFDRHAHATCTHFCTAAVTASHHPALQPEGPRIVLQSGISPRQARHISSALHQCHCAAQHPHTDRQPHSCPSCLPACLLACTAEEHGRGLARWTSGPRTPLSPFPRPRTCNSNSSKTVSRYRLFHQLLPVSPQRSPGLGRLINAARWIGALEIRPPPLGSQPKRGVSTCFRSIALEKCGPWLHSLSLWHHCWPLRRNYSPCA
jgi:hypothetical protein